MKFKVGDTVRIVGHNLNESKGDTGVITDIDDTSFEVNRFWYYEDSLEFFEPENKKWKDMTPQEKGALLLAYHECNEIEFINEDGKWMKTSNPLWLENYGYRVKPKTDKIVHKWYSPQGFEYQIYFEAEHGNPILETIKLEKLV